MGLQKVDRQVMDCMNMKYKEMDRQDMGHQWLWGFYVSSEFQNDNQISKFQDFNQNFKIQEHIKSTNEHELPSGGRGPRPLSFFP